MVIDVADPDMVDQRPLALKSANPDSAIGISTSNTIRTSSNDIYRPTSDSSSLRLGADSSICPGSSPSYVSSRRLSQLRRHAETVYEDYNEVDYDEGDSFDYDVD